MAIYVDTSARNGFYGYIETLKYVLCVYKTGQVFFRATDRKYWKDHYLAFRFGII